MRNATMIVALLACLVVTARGQSPQQRKPTQLAPAVQSQPEPFPAEGDIKLLLTQAERAFDVYANALELESALLPASGVEKDREVLTNARETMKTLRGNPGAFNTPMGFLLVGDLDDASRNAALCGGQAGVQAALDMQVGQQSAAQSKIHLSQACTDASGLLYTVSETAFRMYTKVLLAQDALTKRTFKTLERCGEALKKQPR